MEGTILRSVLRDTPLQFDAVDRMILRSFFDSTYAWEDATMLAERSAKPYGEVSVYPHLHLPREIRMYQHLAQYLRRLWQLYYIQTDPLMREDIFAQIGEAQSLEGLRAFFRSKGYKENASRLAYMGWLEQFIPASFVPVIDTTGNHFVAQNDIRFLHKEAVEYALVDLVSSLYYIQAFQPYEDHEEDKPYSVWRHAPRIEFVSHSRACIRQFLGQYSHLSGRPIFWLHRSHREEYGAMHPVSFLPDVRGALSEYVLTALTTPRALLCIPRPKRGSALDILSVFFCRNQRVFVLERGQVSLAEHVGIIQYAEEKSLSKTDDQVTRITITEDML